MELKVDLDRFDEWVRNSTEEQKREFMIKVDILSHLADDLLKESKISKIIRNRVKKLWHFSPYQNVDLVGTERFNQMFSIENPNILFIQNAIREVLIKAGKEKIISTTKEIQDIFKELKRGDGNSSTG